MNFQYNYNLHGSDRKPLVEAISQILDKPAVYQGAPSFSYSIGNYTVDRNGVLSYGSNIHPDFAAVLISDLQERGFEAERVAIDNMAEVSDADGVPANGTMGTSTENTATEAAMNETNLEEPAADVDIPDAALNTDVTPSADAPGKLTIEIPNTGFTPEIRENLKKIVASKATLLKQALGTDDLSIVELDGRITFPWFTLHDIDGEADAYNRLIAAVCKMAKTQKRVTAVEKPIENAKFTMRLFLIRLGFIGDEYKTARKILLRNLTGNSSWKSGHRPERNETAAIPPNPAEATLVAAQELTIPLEEADAAEYETQEEDAGGETYGK
ncbi:hypothetical protein [Petralouisia muris]|uniref:hypothetical protein n=1 Tax=Petralouisia muris TaxID=3032872 RepID=UPI0023B86CCD|nr:hypothetical protein [Petralouisia muris]